MNFACINIHKCVCFWSAKWVGPNWMFHILKENLTLDQWTQRLNVPKREKVPSCFLSISLLFFSDAMHLSFFSSLIFSFPKLFTSSLSLPHACLSNYLFFFFKKKLNSLMFSPSGYQFCVTLKWGRRLII